MLLTCRESESVFVHDMRDIILKQINLIKSNPLKFKSVMKESLVEDAEPIKERIELLNSDINLLKDKLINYSGKKDDSYKALSNEITERVENLIKERKISENRLLTLENNERLIKETMDIVDSLSATEYDPSFRKLFKKAVIKSRTDITFIIGNENLSNLNLLDLPKHINEKHTIKVRAQIYTVEFGIFFNR